MAADSRRRRHLLLAASIVLLLVAALVLPPLVNINRYQRKIAASLSTSLGRPVEVSGVRLHLLPRPAIEIADFVVESTPGFSAEPVLHCSSVTASLRLSSLWRGSLEIAEISLDEPSLNLERGPQGEWNFASVLLQAARTPQAPTGRQLAGRQRRFPYIEATNARINFKHGNEKLPVSFLNADIAIWLEQPNEWQLRIAAQPTRTDINLSLADTGLVRVTGTVHRASSSSALPVDLRVAWERAPLGQVTRMMMLQDLGWRGDTSMQAHLVGTPEALAIDLAATANDFHREAFEPARPLNLRTRCTAVYRHAADSLDAIHCLSRVGDGSLQLSGAWQGLHADTPRPQLVLAAAGVPAQALLDLLRHTRGRLSQDLTLDGRVDGQLNYAVPPAGGRPSALPVTSSAAAAASGSFEASGLVLHGDGLEQPLPGLHFLLQPAAQPVLLLQPARLDLGGAQPLLADAHMTGDGFQLRLSGGAALDQLRPLANTFGLLPAAFQGLQETGTADYNLSIAGPWLPQGADADQPQPSSAVTGSITVRGVAFQPAYLAEPVHIVTATGTVSPTQLAWNGIAGSFGTTRFSGSLVVPVPCRANCTRHFDLTTAEAGLGAITASLGGSDGSMVQELISRVRTRSRDWPALEGSIHVAQLTLGPVQLAGAAAQLELNDGTLLVPSLEARTLGGTLHASGTVTLGATPQYSAQFALTHLSAPELAQLVKERWGPGLLDVAGTLKLAGGTALALSGSAKGDLRWTWTGGALPGLLTSPLHRFDRWSGQGTVTGGVLSFASSDLVSSGTTSSVAGTIASDRAIRLIVPGTAGAPGDGNITGTLAAPVEDTP